MCQPATSAAESDPAGARFQFSLQSFAGLFVVVALLLGYLRVFGVESIVKCSAVTALALLIGVLVGARTGKLADAMFWSAIGAIFGFLATLGDASYHWSLKYVWPLVGGLTGATAAICPDRELPRRMTSCGAVALAAIAIYMIAFVGFQLAMFADLACAALGGALMAMGVELASRFERHTALPRHLLATAFVIVGITGHRLAIHYATSVYGWLRR